MFRHSLSTRFLRPCTLLYWERGGEWKKEQKIWQHQIVWPVCWRTESFSLKPMAQRINRMEAVRSHKAVSRPLERNSNHIRRIDIKETWPVGRNSCQNSCSKMIFFLNKTALLTEMRFLVGCCSTVTSQANDRLVAD